MSCTCCSVFSFGGLIAGATGLPGVNVCAWLNLEGDVMRRYRRRVRTRHWSAGGTKTTTTTYAQGPWIDMPSVDLACIVETTVEDLGSQTGGELETTTTYELEWEADDYQALIEWYIAEVKPLESEIFGGGVEIPLGGDKIWRGVMPIVDSEEFPRLHTVGKFKIVDHAVLDLQHSSFVMQLSAGKVPVVVRFEEVLFDISDSLPGTELTAESFEYFLDSANPVVEHVGHLIEGAEHGDGLAAYIRNPYFIPAWLVE